MKASASFSLYLILLLWVASCQKPDAPPPIVFPPPLVVIPPVDTVQQNGMGDTSGLIKTIEYSRLVSLPGQGYSVREHYLYDSAKRQIHIIVEQLLTTNSNQFPTNTEIILSYDVSKKIIGVSYKWPTGFIPPPLMPKKITFTYDAQQVYSNLIIDWENGNTINFPALRIPNPDGSYKLTWLSPLENMNGPFPSYTAYFDASGKCLKREQPSSNLFQTNGGSNYIDSLIYDADGTNIESIRHFQRDPNGPVTFDKIIMTATTRAQGGKELIDQVKRLFNGIVEIGANDPRTHFFEFGGVLTNAMDIYERFQISELPVTNATIFFPGLNQYKFESPALKFDAKGRLIFYPGFHYEFDSPASFYTITYYN